MTADADLIDGGIDVDGKKQHEHLLCTVEQQLSRLNYHVTGESLGFRENRTRSRSKIWPYLSSYPRIISAKLFVRVFWPDEVAVNKVRFR
jgi:hypothetical protein